MVNSGSNLLWYRQPACSWNEALPLGNGRLGAMVYGGVESERICLNEDTLWSGSPNFYENEGAYDAYCRARELVKDRKYAEAQKEIEHNFTGLWSQAYMPLGDMLISSYHLSLCKEYKRTLDLSTGVHRVEYSCGADCYTREMFVSAVDQVVALRIRGSRAGSVNLHIAFAPGMNAQTAITDKNITLAGNCPIIKWVYGLPYKGNGITTYGDTDETKGIAYLAESRILTVGGRTVQEGGGIRVADADEVTVYVNCRTSFNGWNRHPVMEGKAYVEPCQKELDAAIATGFEALMERHIKDHAELYDRVQLELGGGDEKLLPTDERLYALENGGEDLALYALYFNFARYLTIAGSRPGTQPMNLQGIWNTSATPPWNSNYTININTEMNYWPTLAVNLPECYEPMIRLVSEVAESGARTAKEYYRAPGFVAHHNTDLWRMTTPVGARFPDSAVYAFWNMSPGWMIRSLWDYYEYTQDEVYLREKAWPLIVECVSFYKALLTQDEQGKYILSPSTSPENYYMWNGRIQAVAKTTAMTQGILMDVFEICIAATQKLEIASEFTQEAARILPMIAGYDIGSEGELMEWNENFVEQDVLHRHLSHMYGLHPGRSISLEETPEWAEACRVALTRRGDESTGWAMGWRVCMWTRLGDGAHAMKLLRRQLETVEAHNPKKESRSGEINIHSGGTYINLFDAHPPFQIDGNFGVCAGIAEMLVQITSDGQLKLLPALPPQWQNGYVCGLRVQGGYTVELTWKMGELTQAFVKADNAGILRMADGRTFAHSAGDLIELM